MTNSIVISLFVLIVAIFVMDAMLLHDDLPVIVGKRALDLIEWVAFWR